MTSKFAPLTRLKKQELEAVRRLLVDANNYIRNLQTELVQAEQDLLDQEVPSHGAISLFSQYQAFTQACHDQIIRKKNEIYYASQERSKIEEDLKKAHVEFEKFNYLQIEEEKAHKVKIQREESLQLDEVAIMGYNARKNT